MLDTGLRVRSEVASEGLNACLLKIQTLLLVACAPSVSPCSWFFSGLCLRVTLECVSGQECPYDRQILISGVDCCLRRTVHKLSITKVGRVVCPNKSNAHATHPLGLVCLTLLPLPRVRSSSYRHCSKAVLP